MLRIAFVLRSTEVQPVFFWFDHTHLNNVYYKTLEFYVVDPLPSEAWRHLCTCFMNGVSVWKTGDRSNQSFVKIQTIEFKSLSMISSLLSSHLLSTLELCASGLIGGSWKMQFGLKKGHVTSYIVHHPCIHASCQIHAASYIYIYMGKAGSALHPTSYIHRTSYIIHHTYIHASMHPCIQVSVHPCIRVIRVSVHRCFRVSVYPCSHVAKRSCIHI